VSFRVVCEVGVPKGTRVRGRCLQSCIIVRAARDITCTSLSLVRSTQSSETMN
jgi:hypothetical protein